MCLWICCQINRLEKLRQTVAEFLLHSVPIGCSVGLVVFSSEASVVVPLKKITSARERQELVSKLPTHAGGSTAIGAALLRGIQVSSLCTTLLYEFCGDNDVELRKNSMHLYITFIVYSIGILRRHFYRIQKILY